MEPLIIHELNYKQFVTDPTIDGQKRSLMIAALRYADTYVKAEGTWLYAERVLYVDWIEQRTLS